MSQGFFIEAEHANRPKHGQRAQGDVFLTHKVREEDRLVCVLADGLGSGVKASVLATLTATMAARYIESYMDVRTAAEVILRTLPVCRERRIGYSTFTIVDLHTDGDCRIIEYGNPPFLFLRNGRLEEMERWPVVLGERGELAFSRFQCSTGDRLALFSDGVSQAGMGEPATPLGWGVEGVARCVQEAVDREPQISARVLATRVVHRACGADGGRAKDDITCGVIYCRKPRKLLLMTGPPFARDKDAALARRFDEFEGRKVICGGVTARIVARELKREVQIDLATVTDDLPPLARMAGADLVTEGAITLSRVATLLDQGAETPALKPNAATRLVDLLLDSDVIELVAGASVNEAHQDPNLPVELDIRRNIVKRIAGLLEAKYLKKVDVKFV